MNIERNAYSKLIKWKASNDRRPLLVRGAVVFTWSPDQNNKN